MTVITRELYGVIDYVLPYLRHKLLISDIGYLLEVDVKFDILP